MNGHTWQRFKHIILFCWAGSGGWGKKRKGTKKRTTTTVMTMTMTMSNTGSILNMDISNIKDLSLLVNRTVHTSTNRHIHTHILIQKAAILATSNITRKFPKMDE
jgi:hypothetical protein